MFRTWPKRCHRFPVGQHFKVSDSTVGRILRSAMLQPHKQKMWLTSHDEKFREKRDDVLRVYYETPLDEHIICLDEKTGMQALERLNPDIAMEPGQPIRREFEYIRHGTLCLMGAYDVREGKMFGFIADKRGGDAFVDLLDVVDTCYPDGSGHIVMDNLSDHDTDESTTGLRTIRAGHGTSRPSTHRGSIRSSPYSVRSNDKS